MEIPDKPQVCLVRVINGTQHPALRFQVTVNAAYVKHGRIRFGSTAGDELVGWWPVEDVVVDRVLGYPSADGKGFTSA